MPLYEYRCDSCEQLFEYIQSINSRPKRKCEVCDGKLEKLVSRSGFVLKGTGWYETDFKGKKPKTSDDSSSKSDSSSSSSSSDSGSSKSDSKSSKSKTSKKKS
ncbi:MAG: FmdB family zinc ribbon protein [Acidobacteriota bacterium]